MQVLDDPHQWPLGGQPADHPEDELEQAGGGADVAAVPGRRRRLQFGEEAGELAPRRSEQVIQFRRRRGPHQLSQGVDQRGEWEAVAAQRHAPADEHPRPAVRRVAAQLVHQPGLADPSLTADEDDRGTAGLRLLQPRLDCLGLPLPPDQDRAHEPLRHAWQCAARFGGRAIEWGVPQRTTLGH